MPRRRMAVSVLAIICALALTACRSADDVISEYNAKQGLPGYSDSYDTSTVGADPDVVALVPDAVAADGKLTIGSNLYWAPAEFQINGQPTGYEIDMMKAVAARMGLELDVKNAEFDSIMPGIPTKYEVGASSFTITAEREVNFNMIQFYTVGVSWAVQAGNPTEFDSADICGRTIGVQTGTTEDEEVAALAEQCAEKPNIQRYDSQDAVTQALVGGKIEAMSADSSVVDYALQRTNGALELQGDITGTAPQGVVVAKDDPEMTAAVQAALQSLMDDGTLEEIFATWGITENVATEALVNPVK